MCPQYQPQLLVVSVHNRQVSQGAAKEEESSALGRKSLLPVKTQAESLSMKFGSGH